MTLKLKNKKNNIVEVTTMRQKLIGCILIHKDKQIRLINKLDRVRRSNSKIVFGYTGVILD